MLSSLDTDEMWPLTASSLALGHGLQGREHNKQSRERLLQKTEERGNQDNQRERKGYSAMLIQPKEEEKKKGGVSTSIGREHGRCCLAALH
jgi:hypothetical protein